MHDAIQVGIPVLVILFGILLNRADIKDLRREVLARFDQVDAELRFFHGKVGELTGRLDEMSKR